MWIIKDYKHTDPTAGREPERRGGETGVSHDPAGLIKEEPNIQRHKNQEA